MTRNALELVSAVEAIAGTKPTHVLRRQSDKGLLFRGTKTQCQWVKEGYDIDLRTDHPDSQGETYIEEATG